MDLTTVLSDLESAGTEQHRKVYRRHGVSGDMFGVSYATLGKLVKKIKKDQALAEQLWATGNHDARVLATMIADPNAIKDRLADAWVKDLDNYVITDAFAKMMGQTPLARKKMEKWMRAKGEWIGRVGWLLVHPVADDPSVPDEVFEAYLETIEKDIHAAKNRVRDAMNSALIGIGIRNAALQKKAIAAAGRIGKVDVDHGDTNCKTPDAAEYIRKAVERKAQRRR